jgi:hypothetical protein
MQYLLLGMPFIIVGLLFVSGWAMGAQSGWYEMMRLYPDRDEKAVQVFQGQTGWMKSGLSFNGILTLSVCPSGLRVAVPRIFGPFSKPYFVPWGDIRVYRLTQYYMPAARLDFAGKGELSVRAITANRLARVAGKNWPEAGPFPFESTAHILASVILMWALLSAVGAGFLTVIPLVFKPAEPFLPLPITLGLPALLMGLVACIQFTVLANAADAERKAGESAAGG